MSSYFNCVAYDDVDATIQIGEKAAVFLALKTKDEETHITLNPIQAHMLAKYLSTALSQIRFHDLQDAKNFGNLTVEIE